MIFMFDDINMSYRDKWNHQSSNELLRQWLNYSGWYQTKTCGFRKIKDINLVATVTLRKEVDIIDERLGWHFATVGFSNHPGCQIELIYTQILTSCLTNCPSKRVQQNAPGMILRASLDFFEIMNKSITPSPTNFLEVMTEKHLLLILGGFIDCAPQIFNDFEDVAYMWIHEVCRTSLDRFTDATTRSNIFKKIKTIASGTFKIREKLF